MRALHEAGLVQMGVPRSSSCWKPWPASGATRSIPCVCRGRSPRNKPLAKYVRKLGDGKA